MASALFSLLNDLWPMPRWHRLAFSFTLTSDQYSVLQLAGGGEAWNYPAEHHPLVSFDWRCPFIAAWNSPRLARAILDSTTSSCSCVPAGISQADRCECRDKGRPANAVKSG